MRALGVRVVECESKWSAWTVPRCTFPNASVPVNVVDAAQRVLHLFDEDHAGMVALLLSRRTELRLATPHDSWSKTEALFRRHYANCSPAWSPLAYAHRRVASFDAHSSAQSASRRLVHAYVQRETCATTPRLALAARDAYAARVDRGAARGLALHAQAFAHVSRANVAAVLSTPDAWSDALGTEIATGLAVPRIRLRRMRRGAFSIPSRLEDVLDYGLNATRTRAIGGGARSTPAYLDGVLDYEFNAQRIRDIGAA